MLDGTKSSIIDLDSKVSPAILASIFGCNVSLIYQHVQQGRLPNPIIESTYREAIQAYLTYYKSAQDLKIEKAKAEERLQEAKLEADLKFKEGKLKAEADLKEKARASKGDSFYGDDGMPPLLAAKAKQDIRLGIAREQQLWVKASIERGEYLSTESLVELAEPIIMSIRQSLLTLALTSSEAEKAVDEVMFNLHNLGVVLVDQASFDADNFIKAIMAREVDITEIDIDSEHEALL